MRRMLGLAEIAALLLVGWASMSFMSIGNSTLQLASEPTMRGRVIVAVVRRLPGLDADRRAADRRDHRGYRPALRPRRGRGVVPGRRGGGIWLARRYRRVGAATPAGRAIVTSTDEDSANQAASAIIGDETSTQA